MTLRDFLKKCGASSFELYEGEDWVFVDDYPYKTKKEIPERYLDEVVSYVGFGWDGNDDMTICVRPPEKN